MSTQTEAIYPQSYADLPESWSTLDDLLTPEIPYVPAPEPMSHRIGRAVTGVYLALMVAGGISTAGTSIYADGRTAVAEVIANGANVEAAQRATVDDSMQTPVVLGRSATSQVEQARARATRAQELAGSNRKLFEDWLALGGLAAGALVGRAAWRHRKDVARMARQTATAVANGARSAWVALREPAMVASGRPSKPLTGAAELQRGVEIGILGL